MFQDLCYAMEFSEAIISQPMGRNALKNPIARPDYGWCCDPAGSTRQNLCQPSAAWSGRELPLKTPPTGG